MRSFTIGFYGVDTAELSEAVIVNGTKRAKEYVFVYSIYTFLLLNGLGKSR